MARSLCLLVIIGLIGWIAVNADVPDPAKIPRKELAGPPSEFQNHKLPVPLDAALLEDSAFLDVYLEPKGKASEEGQKLVWKTDLLVDSSEEFIVSVFNALKNDDFKVKLRNPDGEKVDVDKYMTKGEFPIGGHFIPETSFRFTEPKVGVWKLKLSTLKKYSGDELSNITNSLSPNGAIILWNKSKTRIHTHLNTYNLRLGQQIGLVTSVTEDSEVIQGVRPQALRDSVATAIMDIFLPDGTEVDVPLHDDGLHGDFGVNDGIYGGSLAATESGIYRASAVLTGTTSSGAAFIRTTQHLIPVIVDEITLSGQAVASLKDKERLTISLGITPLQGLVPLDNLYRAYAEVYGKDASNNDIAVCWIGGLSTVQVSGQEQFIDVELNLKWLSMASAKGPLTLKNVVIQETSSFLPVSEVPEITVTIPDQISQYVNNLQFVVTEITKEMREGVRTRPPKSSVNATAASKLILLHGYCSGTNPWAASAAEFSNALFFEDQNANRNNNDFAALVHQYANNQGVISYGLVGHSQGGMVALHLLNYFESGLDDAEGERLIQSVGTPYLGCSAAGSAANLGKAFGVGCGANQDLSTDGARLWLAGVTAASRKHIYYYTTTYEQGNFFGDYCNMAINAILEWPNDGTSEFAYAQLSNANNMGNTQKQCHTSDMKYPAQYHDKARNKLMSDRAAR